MCGIDGVWDTPDTWPDAVTGCIPTAMCSNVPDDSSLPESSGWKLKNLEGDKL